MIWQRYGFVSQFTDKANQFLNTIACLQRRRDVSL
jgi:hypothetical protein